MSSDSEDEEAARDVRGNLLFSGNRARLEYKLGSISCSETGETSAIIGIAELGGRLIVGVPWAAWHKKVAKRKLEKGALGKAILVDVVGAYPADLGEPAEELVVRLWVGVLAMQAEASVSYQQGVEHTYSFGADALPYGEALVKVADEHFAFTTAESGGGGEGMFRRMSQVEAGLAEMKNLLQDLVAQKSSEASKPPLLKPRTKSKAGKSRGEELGLQGLDPSTVGAARAAGISDEALKEMGKLVRAKKTRATEAAVSLVDPLAELEAGSDGDDGAGLGLDELDGVLDGAETEEPNRMEKAILQLTRIVGTLVTKKNPDLDTVLDHGSLGSSSESGGLGAGKRSTAALRFLSRALEEQPKVIYDAVEAQLQKDLGGLATGDSMVKTWLCSRSRIQNFHTQVRWSWQVGAIWQDLINGDADRARARAALLIAASDQSSIDGGSWVMSSVSLLEAMPPFQEFAKHSLPGPAENQTSSLYDPRWSEVFLSALRERDACNDARRKLAQLEKGGRPTKPDDKDLPWRPPKGGKEGKGGKGGNANAEKPEK